MKFFWGLVVAGLGVLLLGTNLGWWSNDVWSTIWLLWPLIIIVVGLRFIIHSDKVFVVSALLLVLLAGYVVVEKPAVVIDKIDGDKEVFSENISEKATEGTKKIDFRLDMGASEVSFGSLSDEESQNLLYQVETRNYGQLEKSLTMIGETAKIKLAEQMHGRMWLGQRLNERSLVARFSRLLPLEIELNGGASKFDLDFRDLRLTKLNINSGASKGEITFGSVEKNTDVLVETGVSKMTFNIPKGSGLELKFESEDGLNSKDFDGNLNLENTQNHIYRTKDFDSAEKKIIITLSAGVSDIELNQY